MAKRVTNVQIHTNSHKKDRFGMSAHLYLQCTCSFSTHPSTECWNYKSKSLKFECWNFFRPECWNFSDFDAWVLKLSTPDKCWNLHFWKTWVLKHKVIDLSAETLRFKYSNLPINLGCFCMKSKRWNFDLIFVIRNITGNKFYMVNLSPHTDINDVFTLQRKLQEVY